MLTIIIIIISNDNSNSNNNSNHNCNKNNARVCVHPQAYIYNMLSKSNKSECSFAPIHPCLHWCTKKHGDKTDPTREWEGKGERVVNRITSSCFSTEAYNAKIAIILYHFSHAALVHSHTEISDSAWQNNHRQRMSSFTGWVRQRVSENVVSEH